MTTQPELVDNRDRYLHTDALRWLGEHRGGAAAVATGYVRIGGLVALATLPGPEDRPIRLLLGAVPDPGLGAISAGQGEARLARDLFQETLDRLREERDFDAFPESRRTTSLDLVEKFVGDERVEVRRFTTRFLHGKTYLFGERAPSGKSLTTEGAVLVTSANLTSGGLEHNLELGAVRYDPSAVLMALDWFDELWSEADDFKDELLRLLFPPEEPYTPQAIFHRALIELYGDDVEEEAEGEVRAGGITLTRFQEDGYRRARHILDEFGGVVYADGVGTGKTEIGLRFVTDYARDRGLFALVVTPAQLRESLWAKRLDEAGLPGQVVSYQQLARDSRLGGNGGRELHIAPDNYRLVVVDEAHAFRNADNTWYAALDRLLGGTPKHLVLLTATPVNNALWDLFNLVMLFARHDAAFGVTKLRLGSLRQLFLGAGAKDPDQIREELLFPLVDAIAVRRDRRFLQAHYVGESFTDGTPVRFPEPVLHEFRYDLDTVYPGVFHEVVDTIDSLSMARYLPSKYEGAEPGELAREEALAGLMRSQLLKRFESSVAAARITLGRMILAHEALVTAWETRGMVPSLATLKDLVREGEEGAPLSDLVAAALDEDVDAKSADAYDPAFLTDVKADLERLRAMGAKLERLAELPDPKLDTLADILTATPAEKVAVFCSYADTARHVSQAIQLDPARFGSRPMTVVIGTETDAEQRMAQLERFCPRSVTGDEDFEPEEGEVDLMIATDILSEGQNLQEAQAVVSFDLPWNPQRVVQRNGRVIRLRSPHDVVHLYTMLPKHGDLEEALKLEAKVRGKIAAANATFGMESQVLQDMEAVQRTYADLEEERTAESYRDLGNFFGRIERGDESVLDEGQGPGSGSFAGEQYRWILSRLLQQGDFPRLRRLPWGIGSGFPKRGLPADRAGVFFACRTSAGDRHWRFVGFDGRVIREDLEMLRLIDPGDRGRADLPLGAPLEDAWRLAAEDICRVHNEQLDPARAEAVLSASQRWALSLLRSPDLPDEPQYSRAEEALGVGRNQLVRRALSDIRRRAREETLTIAEQADLIVDLVDRFGLRPEPIPQERPVPIAEADLGVVCFQVVLGEYREAPGADLDGL